jgi:SAM-dependent methyltransferase
VLDVNPGTCALKEALPGGTVYVGVEQSAELRASVAEKGVAVADWDVPFLPQEDGAIDRVVCGAFLEHLPTYRDALDFVLETKRVLAPGGRAVFIVPEFRQLGPAFFDDYKHTWPTSWDRVTNMARDCGLRPAGRVHTIGWITMVRDPLTWLAAAGIGIGIGILNVGLVDRIVRTAGLADLAYKVKKTLFELSVVTVEKA